MIQQNIATIYKGHVLDYCPHWDSTFKTEQLYQSQETECEKQFIDKGVRMFTAGDASDSIPEQKIESNAEEDIVEELKEPTYNEGLTRDGPSSSPSYQCKRSQDLTQSCAEVQQLTPETVHHRKVRKHILVRPYSVIHA